MLHAMAGKQYSPPSNPPPPLRYDPFGNEQQEEAQSADTSEPQGQSTPLGSERQGNTQPAGQSASQAQHGLLATDQQAQPAAHPQSHPSTQSGSRFLSHGLYEQIVNKSKPTVTEAYTQATADKPKISIEEVVEQVYGKRHHAHHRFDTVKGEEQQLERKEEHGSGGGLSKILDKVHLGKSHGDSGEFTGTEAGQTGHDDKEQFDQRVHQQWDAIQPLAPGQLQEIEQCGKWGVTKPSELFLNVYAQALLSLERDHPLNNLVSPPLLGSCGVIPLTIISVIPDIIQHYADVIVRAEHEVILATNFWEASTAAHTITDAFRELSKRAQARGQKITIKMMYDRGNPQQVLSPHQTVDVKTYTGDKVKLPHPDEIPGIDLEVQNYHVPPVGTFHSKYMVVDRKVALLNSNNIQDRVNVEMMTHIEGPIVQSFYDMALISWSNPFHPPLPLLSQPPRYPDRPAQSHYSFGSDHPVLGDKGDLNAAADDARNTLAKHHAETEQPQVTGKGKLGELWDGSNLDEAERIDRKFDNSDAINQHLNTGTKIGATDDSPPPNAKEFRPIILHSPHDPVPMALVNRAPRGKPGHGDTYVPQDQAWLAAFKFAKRNVFIQTPTFNAIPVVHAALEACQRGILVEIYADLGFNDEGELLPYQGGTNQMVALQMYAQLDDAARKNLKWYWYTAKDQKTPLNAKDKSRNCHVKLMIVDEQIGIQGNGNQDTQSWFHSQEINVLLDSALISREWREAIDANQNTKFYGLVEDDGVWRDKDGKELPGAEKDKIPHGPGKSFVGVKGAIQRVRGEGGF